jgi:hypothetical protein
MPYLGLKKIDKNIHVTSPNQRNMDVKDFSAPSKRFVCMLSHLLIVADQDRTREFTRR